MEYWSDGIYETHYFSFSQYSIAPLLQHSKLAVSHPLIMFLHPLLIVLAPFDLFHPGLIVQIPLDGFFDPGVK